MLHHLLLRLWPQGHSCEGGLLIRCAGLSIVTGAAQRLSAPSLVAKARQNGIQPSKKCDNHQQAQVGRDGHIFESPST